MKPIEVEDYKGRVARLLKHRAYMVNGSRYGSRKSIARVIRGEATKIWGGSDFTSPGWMRWHSVCGYNDKGIYRLRFGCHVFYGENAKKMKEWALNA